MNYNDKVTFHISHMTFSRQQQEMHLAQIYTALCFTLFTYRSVVCVHCFMLFSLKFFLHIV